MQPLMPPINTPDNLFHDGNPTTGVEGTIVPAEHLNNEQGSIRDVQSEMIAILTAAAMEPDSTAGQLLAALNKLYAPGNDTLGALASLVGAANKLPYFTGPKNAALTDLTAFARTLLSRSDAEGVLSDLGLANAVIGDSVKHIGFSTNDVKKPYFRFPDTDSVILLATQQALGGKQDSDATLSALAGLTGAANKLAYFTGADIASLTDLTQVGRDIIGKSDIAAVIQYLGVATTSQLIGIGQTYRVVTDKVLGVTYTNTSKQPWVVSLKVNLPTSAEVLIKVDGVMAGGGNAANNAGISVWAYPSAIIPPGSTYVVTAQGGTLIQWVELK